MTYIIHQGLHVLHMDEKKNIVVKFPVWFDSNHFNFDLLNLNPIDFFPSTYMGVDFKICSLEYIICGTPKIILSQALPAVIYQSL